MKRTEICVGCLLFCREIMSAFPEAKVILTKRDPIKWHHSVKETIYQIRDLGTSSLIKSVMKLLGRWQHFECVLKLSTGKVLHFNLHWIVSPLKMVQLKFHNRCLWCNWEWRGRICQVLQQLDKGSQGLRAKREATGVRSEGRLGAPMQIS